VVAIVTQALSVVAEAVLGAVGNTCSDFTSITRPTGVAVASSLDTFAVAVTDGAVVTGAKAVAVRSAPTVLTHTFSIKTLSMTSTVVWTGALRTIVSLIPFIADAHLTLVLDNTLSSARAGRRTRRLGAGVTRKSGLAEARTVVAVSVTSAIGSTLAEGAVETIPAVLAVASVVQAFAMLVAVGWAGANRTVVSSET